MILDQSKRNRYAFLALCLQAGLTFTKQLRVFLTVEDLYAQIRQGDPLYARIALHDQPSTYFVLASAFLLALLLLIAAFGIKRNRPWGRPMGLLAAVLSFNGLAWPAALAAIYFLIPSQIVAPIEEEVVAAFKSEPKSDSKPTEPPAQ